MFPRPDRQTTSRALLLLSSYAHPGLGTTSCWMHQAPKWLLSCCCGTRRKAWQTEQLLGWNRARSLFLWNVLWLAAETFLFQGDIYKFGKYPRRKTYVSQWLHSETNLLIFASIKHQNQCVKWLSEYLHLTLLPLYCYRIWIICNQNWSHYAIWNLSLSNPVNCSGSAEIKSKQLIYCCCSHSAALWQCTTAPLPY